jgi:hypothetical protein
MGDRTCDKISVHDTIVSHEFSKHFEIGVFTVAELCVKVCIIKAGFPSTGTSLLPERVLWKTLPAEIGGIMLRLMQCGLMLWLILTQTMSLGVTELRATEVAATEGTQTNHQSPFPPLREFDGFRKLRVADRVKLALADQIPARPQGTDSPLVESYLLEGKIAEGNAALTARLQAKPNDDQARFGLGMVQFFQGFEHLTAGLYRHGLRTERLARNSLPQLSATIPQNPNPQPISYAELRVMLQRFVDDLNAAEATLAAIQAPDVKLPLHVGLIKLDATGQGKLVSGKMILVQNQFRFAPAEIDFLWLQGTAATPYLENGVISRFADPQFAANLEKIFGPQQFWGFALWFN